MPGRGEARLLLPFREGHVWWLIEEDPVEETFHYRAIHYTLSHIKARYEGHVILQGSGINPVIPDLSLDSCVVINQVT